MESTHDQNRKIIVGFDVDGTLISADDDSPRYEIIQVYRTLQKLGCKMVVASGCGKQYATRWAEKLGLGRYPEQVEIWEKDELVKADIVFDDATNSMGKVGIFV